MMEAPFGVFGWGRAGFVRAHLGVTLHAGEHFCEGKPFVVEQVEVGF